MQKEELAAKLIGAEVLHSTKGRGKVVAAEAKPEHVTVTVEAGGERLVFSAFIAAEKQVLVFPNEEIRGILKQLKTIYEEEKVPKKEAQASVNPNEEKIKNLAKKLGVGESISLDLIEAYNQSAFESALVTVGAALFRRKMNGWHLTANELYMIVVYMSYIALKEYDGNFHERFCFSVAKANNGYADLDAVRTTVYAVINDLGLRKAVHYFDPKSYVAVPLCIACVPHYRMGDLFRIAYDIFKKTLLFSEDVSDEQIAEKTRDVLAALKRKKLIAEASEEPIKGTNYLFSAYTKSCITSGYNFDALVEIFVAAIRLIINYLTKQADAYVVPEFYRDGLKAWIETFENDSVERDAYVQNKLLSSPSLSMDTKYTIFLKTGAYFMDDTHDHRAVTIRVYNGSNILYECKLDGANDIEYNDEAIGGYKINSKKIALSNNCSPIGELSYKLYCSGQLLYDSKERLYRDALFFCAKDGTEAKPGTDHINEELIVVSATDNHKTLGDVATVICKRKKYFVSQITIENGDPYVIGETSYIFRKVKGVEFGKYYVPWIRFYSSLERRIYPIYKYIEILVPASCDGRELAVEFDDKLLDCGRGDYRIYRYSQNIDRTFVYGIKVLCGEPGFHQMRFKNTVSGQYIGKKMSFVYDGGLQKANVTYPENGQSYDLVSSFLQEAVPVAYTYGMTLLKTKAYVPHLGPGELHLLPSAPSYSFDGTEWFGAQAILLYDVSPLQREISICGPSGMTAFYFGANGKKARLELTETGENTYKLPISYLRSVNDRTGVVRFEYGNCGKSVRVFPFPWIEYIECSPSEDGTGLRLRVTFKSKNQLWLVVKDAVSGKALSEQVVSSGESVILEKSKIPINVSDIIIGVHARGTSLFEKFALNPLKTIRYTIPYDIIIGSDTKILYRSDEKIITARIYFTGADLLKVSVFPSGYSLLLREATVKSGEEITFDVKHALFSAYTLQLGSVSYPPTRINRSSLNVTAKSEYLGRTFEVKKMYLGNDSEKEISTFAYKFPGRYTLLNGEIFVAGELLMRGKTPKQTAAWLKMGFDSFSDGVFEIFKPIYEHGKSELKRFSIQNAPLVKIQIKTGENG